eukprot:13491968-Alexandrium_andersonii.AAC.1
MLEPARVSRPRQRTQRSALHLVFAQIVHVRIPIIDGEQAYRRGYLAGPPAGRSPTSPRRPRARTSAAA